MLDYYLVLLVSFSGILFGYLLQLIAKEEVDQFKRFLLSIRYISLLAVFLLLFLVKTDIALLIILLAFLVLEHMHKSKWIYCLLPVLLWLSYKTPKFQYAACLLFIYGLSEGSFYKKEELYHSAAYLVVGMFLGLIS